MTRDARWAQGPLATELLTDPIPAGALKQFRRSQPSLNMTTVLYAVVGLVFGTVLGAIFALLPLPIALPYFVKVALFVIICAAIVGGIRYSIRTNKLRDQWRRWAFAQANGLTYVGDHKDRYNGMIFNISSDHVSHSVIRTNSIRPVEFGNLVYTTGSGDSSSTHRWGYVAVRLNNFLPHIVLDAEGNNSLIGSNLPVSLARQQRLSLEGDFDKYFHLFCPAGYERDALYLFTPDIMTRFMQTASQLDVEIIDDWVYFYSRNELSTLDAQTWHWLYGVIDTFLAKIEQWERWRDGNLTTTSTAHLAPGADFAPDAHDARIDALSPHSVVAPPGVAPQGQRLKKGINWMAYLTAGALVAFTLLQQFFMRH